MIPGRSWQDRTKQICETGRPGNFGPVDISNKYLQLSHHYTDWPLTEKEANKQQESIADDQISMHEDERGSLQKSRYRRSIDSEFEDELHSSIPLNNFKIVILGQRVPDNLLKKYYQENATFDFFHSKRGRVHCAQWSHVSQEHA